jgi:hypothetical protein
MVHGSAGAMVSANLVLEKGILMLDGGFTFGCWKTLTMGSVVRHGYIVEWRLPT